MQQKIYFSIPLILHFNLICLPEEAFDVTEPLLQEIEEHGTTCVLHHACTVEGLQDYFRVAPQSSNDHLVTNKLK